MRKIEAQMVAAIKQGKDFKLDNTEVRANVGGCFAVLLHGHLIAEKAMDGVWRFNLCGWNTPTTRSRINTLVLAFCEDYRNRLVKQDKGDAVLYIDGVRTVIGDNEWF